VHKLLIIAPCFYPTASPAELMVKSAKLHGLNVDLYGIGKPFHAHGADAQVVQLYDHMVVQVADYALITDCRDVLFFAGEDEIMEKFLMYQAKLVMSAEQGCWPPDDEVLKSFTPREHGYTYVNAGQYIGEWAFVRSCLKHLLDNYRGKGGMDNSQPWWALAKARGELDYTLDSSCLLFQSMSGGADSHVEELEGRLWNRFTLTKPCSVHFNGNPGNDAPQQNMYARLFTWIDESGMPYDRR
jgi:hypothetical protein